MEREQYAIMARQEERHWWYTGMRRVALAVLEGVLDGRRDCASWTRAAARVGRRWRCDNSARSSAWTWPGRASSQHVNAG